MNTKHSKRLAVIREALIATAAALVAYGLGTAAIWQEITGIIVGILTIVWSWQSNDGWDALSSMLRKVLSSAGAVLVLTGIMNPTHAELILGAILNILAVVWTVFEKADRPPPPIPILLLLACASCLLIPSCTQGPNGEYPLTGSIMFRDAESGAKAGMTFSPGAAPRASLYVPLYDETGKLISMTQLNYDFSQVDPASSK